ncbi:MAG TPA: phage tail sheath C-terminal domain-containing protein [Longimicrobium sp.]|nr:phage tail sheath C-terminal domain-containing protein [Longimicrobium sp.]
MPTYKTPDVYVEEISVFPPSVAEVETAVPAFVGYTERARRTTDGDLLLRPTKIYSLKEFEDLFGFAFEESIDVDVTVDAVTGEMAVTGFDVAGVAPTDTFLPTYLLYYAVKMFFDNGGGQCYVISIGGFTDPVDAADMTAGLDALRLEDEPTLIVVPEMARLAEAGYRNVSQAALLQCAQLGDRFAILDAYRGALGQNLDSDVSDGQGGFLTNLEAARDVVGNANLKYGALYYPYVRTTLNYWTDEDATVDVAIDGGTPAALGTLRTANTAVYNFVRAALKDRFVIMPPSGAVAGVYAHTDETRGVWKAPANVSLADVLEPIIRLDNVRQDDLNVDATTGKSINAIRAFAGKGTLVWGGRTLAGNDNEWRYISVRRFFNTAEESIKKSTYWAVFEPNDANTWVKVRGMIENYLTQKWREGALAGATPKEAFFVRCGLGTTMSAVDILEGRMNVEIGMAVVRPAEFIILKFSHKLQTS